MPTLSNRYTPSRNLEKSGWAAEYELAEPELEEPLLSNEWRQEFDGRLERKLRRDEQ